MVFQHFNLFPHMTVIDNVTLAPLLTKKLDKSAAEKKAVDLLAQVGLAEKANVKPATLSGGQKQRVAIARALAMNPVDHAVRRGHDSVAPPRDHRRLRERRRMDRVTTPSYQDDPASRGRVAPNRCGTRCSARSRFAEAVDVVLGVGRCGSR